MTVTTDATSRLTQAGRNGDVFSV